MNCKTAELYMDALFDNELPVKDSLEIVDHIERCKDCTTNWELGLETKSKLKHYVDCIELPRNLLNKIEQTINTNEKGFYQKPFLLVASVILLVFILFTATDLSELFPFYDLHKIYNTKSSEIISNDLNQISKHTGIDLKHSHLVAFNQAAFKLHGATNVPHKNIKFITLKNNKGQKVSICFLPKNFHISNHGTDSVNGVVFNYGKSKNYNVTYWKKNEKTIALISDSLSHIEMMDLALPLVADEV